LRPHSEATPSGARSVPAVCGGGDVEISSRVTIHQFFARDTT
jgi:hypothetical protein